MLLLIPLLFPCFLSVFSFPLRSLFIVSNIRSYSKSLSALASCKSNLENNKRILSFLIGGSVIIGYHPIEAVHAIDPSSLAKYIITPGKGIDPSQLKTLTDVQNTLDAADIDYTMMNLGASYREFREGRGTKTLQPGSIVTAEMTIRCKSLATANDKGGVKYYDTKVDTPNKSLTWKVGSGSLPPAVEEALLGMKRSALRRVELPSQLVFKARADKQLPLPSEKNEDGNRYYKRLFKTDATLLIEVLVIKIDDGVDKKNI